MLRFRSPRPKLTLRFLSRMVMNSMRDMLVLALILVGTLAEGRDVENLHPRSHRISRSSWLLVSRMRSPC